MPRSADGEVMTRHEEKLTVTTEFVEAGRVRVRKYVTTERESVTVPITREEIRIEREQITASGSSSGQAAGQSSGKSSSSQGTSGQGSSTQGSSQVPSQSSGRESGVRTEIGENEREIVLHEERPIVHTEAVPVERIRVRTEQVTEERTIEGDVRREHFDVDDSTGRHRRGGSGSRQSSSMGSSSTGTSSSMGQQSSSGSGQSGMGTSSSGRSGSGGASSGGSGSGGSSSGSSSSGGSSSGGSGVSGS